MSATSGNDPVVFPDKDQLMLWADANMEQIIRQLFPRETAGLKFRLDIRWYVADQPNEDGTMYHTDMIVTASSGVDYVYETGDVVAYGETIPDALKGKRRNVRNFQPEVRFAFYQTMLSIGEVIKAVNTLRFNQSHNIIWCVISSDDSYADLLKRQEIRFIKAPPEAAKV